MRARPLWALLSVIFLPLSTSALEREWIDVHRKHLDPLFAALGSNNPALQEAKNDWQRGASVAACDALVSYFRTRPAPLSEVPPTNTPASAYRERAEAFLAGTVAPLHLPQPLKRLENGRIDWYDRGPGNDKEYAWMLNRHRILYYLLLSARESSDPRFREAASAFIKDWVLSNPYPDRLTFSPPWRALEVARRIVDVWGPAFAWACSEQGVDDAALLLLLASIPDHADALLEHSSIWGGNHLITEKKALTLIGLLWPEFSSAEDWAKDGITAVSEELIDQSYPDGAFHELSNHYQRVVLNNAQAFVELLIRAGKPVPPNLEARVKAMWTYFATVMKPDGSGPKNNAADREPNAAILRSLIQRVDAPQWLYAATFGLQGEPIAGSPSRFFPWAGQAIFRSGWDREADWAFFDLGPAGSAHQHDDALHLSATLAGENFLVDSGRYTYEPGPWKDYFISAEAHNVLTIGGRDRQPSRLRNTRPQSDGLEQTADFVAAHGELWFNGSPGHRGSRGWRQERTVIYLVAERAFIIVDRLTGFGPIEATFHWNFAPEQNRSRLEAHFALIATAAPVNLNWVRAREDPVGGWDSPEYGERVPKWQMAAVAPIDGPTTFVWALAPSLEQLSATFDGARTAVASPRGTLRLDRQGNITFEHTQNPSR